MFTGLIEEIGIIKSIGNLGGGRKITVSASKIMDDLKIDDSVSINGACQTVIKVNSKEFEVIAVEETLRKTTLGSLKSGDEVNLERAMKVSDRLGGHIVQGHVDTVGKVLSIKKENTGILYRFSFPSDFAKYLVNTGSICINGISLTTAKVESNSFDVALIPHTISVTTFKNLKQGSEVNLEFDILGKYIEKMLNHNKNSRKSNLDIYIDQPEY